MARFRWFLPIAILLRPKKIKFGGLYSPKNSKNMRSGTITDVFFDLDHTLWDFDRNSFLALKSVFRKYGVGVNVELFTDVYEPINEAYWKLYREEKISKEQLRRGRLIDAFNDFNIQFSLQQIDDMAACYIDELPKNNYLLDGAIAILDYLKDKYALHIITNGFKEVQHIKLKNSGISNYFKTVTSSEEVGLKKPNPVVFKTALEQAGVSKEKTLMIGDSFEADILGAEAFGMQTIFYNYRQEKVSDGYASVNSLVEIENYL